MASIYKLNGEMFAITSKLKMSLLYLHDLKAYFILPIGGGPSVVDKHLVCRE
jgi:hypothetical protein